MNAAPASCSEKQAIFLAQIAASRAVPAHIVAAAQAAQAGTLSQKEASNAIDAGLKCPYKPRPSAPAVAEKGYYLLEGDVFVVTASKETGKLYAKKLILAGGKGSWAYAPGMIYKLTPAMRLSVEDAAALGKQHGVCMVCGRNLTDPTSVAQGIGPVCITRL